MGGWDAAAAVAVLHIIISRSLTSTSRGGNDDGKGIPAFSAWLDRTHRTLTHSIAHSSATSSNNQWNEINPPELE